MRLIAFFLLVSLYAQAQDKVTVNYRQEGDTYTVFADNDEWCEVSIKLDMNLTNMNSSDGNHIIFVVPSRTKNYSLTTLTTIDSRKNSNFDVNSLTSLGNHYQTEYDKEFPYHLPYESGTTRKIMQGYHGSLSHSNSKALDFNIPKGGKILAARDGVVIAVKDRNSRSCPSESCNKFNNYVRISHSDGTVAEYTHIVRNSAKVRPGDRVEIGQHIASCGNVGWATGPHLHFEVFLINMDGKFTVPTKFKISDAEPITLLEEKQSYTKSY